MGSHKKVTAEMITEVFQTAKMHVTCASKLLKDLKTGEDAFCNIALYHLVMFLKISINIVCIRFKIEYADDDPMDKLFEKTVQFLPANILNMAKDACYWYNSVQYVRANVKTVDEAVSVARTIERYFNESILTYACEIRDSVEKPNGYISRIKPLNIF